MLKRLRAHRVRMAKYLAFIGRWLKWDDLVAAVTPVLSNEEDPARLDEEPTATLWLISDWKPDEVLPIALVPEGQQPAPARKTTSRRERSQRRREAFRPAPDQPATTGHPQASP